MHRLPADISIKLDPQLNAYSSPISERAANGVRRALQIFDGAHLSARRFLLDHLQLRPSDVLVDIGGGTGIWSRTVLPRVGGLYFIDPEIGGYGSLSAVKHAFRQWDDRVLVVKGNGYALPLPDSSVTKAICTEVIEHVEHPEQVIREISRVLKPGGLALVTTTPDPLFVASYDWVLPRATSRLPRSLRRRTYLRLGFDAYQQEIGHIQRTTLEQLVDYCTWAGLEVVVAGGLHKRLGAMFEEIRWGMPLVAMALLPLTLLIYRHEAKTPGRGLSPRVIVRKPTNNG